MARKFRTRKAKSEAKKTGIPGFLGPHRTGQAYSIWPAGSAKSGEFRYHGLHGTAEAKENYRRWLAELRSEPVVAPTGAGELPLVCVAEMWEFFLDDCRKRGRYHKHGRATSSRGNFASAMKYVLDLYASWPVNQIGPYQLNRVRQAMDDQKLRRTSIAAYLAKIKFLWNFAASWGLVDPAANLAVQAWRPSAAGNAGLPAVRVLSVEESLLRAVQEVVSSAIGTMLDICCWSGCRIGEVIVARTCDFSDDDEAIPEALRGSCWIFRPMRWKTEHTDQPRRLVLLGPQAIALVQPWLRAWEPEGFLFRPYEAMVTMIRQRYAASRGPKLLWPKAKPRVIRDPSRPYSYAGVWSSIDRACKQLKIGHWSPHQLRHLAATRLAKQYGLEPTQILLGHADIKTTIRYVDPDVITMDDRRKFAPAFAAIAQMG